MKILELTDVSRKDTLIYYRREFMANAVIEVLSKSRTIPVEFILEQSPLGKIDTKVNIKQDLDFPVLPLISKLKHYIRDMDERGVLP